MAAPYYDDPVYIDALAASTRDLLGKLAFEPEVILASFHGMPQDYIDKGDPYYDQCVEDTQLLREQLNLDETKLMLTFQSRFGRAKWLEPATTTTVKALARRGVNNLAVITPGRGRLLWKRSRRSRSRTPTSSRSTAARVSPSFPVQRQRAPVCWCSRRWRCGS